MRGHLKRYVLGFGFGLVLSSVALAAVNFQKINRPGATNTLPSGINDAGWIVGTSENSREEGFLLREGEWKTIFDTDPAAVDTALGGINNKGEIVGTWDERYTIDTTTYEEDHCFLWDEENGYKTFDPFDTEGSTDVDTSEGSDCNGINNGGDKGGDTVGSYADTSGIHGWLRKANGAFSTVDFNNDPSASTEAFGINKARDGGDGDIVGAWCCNTLGNDSGFLRQNGVYTEIDFPGSSTTSTDAYGINDKRDIVGSYTDSNGEHGFVRLDGEYKTVDVNFSDAYETNKVTGINNRGCMVGVYTSGDANGPNYGFKAGLRAVDGDGEEAGRHGGRAYMHVHEDDCMEQPDREDYSDRDPSARTNVAHSVTIAGLGTNNGVDFHSTQNTAVTYDNVAHSVTIAGLGTNNGSQVAFTIVMVDSSLVPPGFFSITLSDGYSNTGSLLAGAITLH
jgi:hypothetical protein